VDDLKPKAVAYDIDVSTIVEEVLPSGEEKARSSMS